MKAFTNIEQSQKLAELLPLESADMWYHPYPNDEYWYDVPNIGNADLKYNQLPCWSLASLLDVLPKIVNTQTLFIETSAALWHIGYRDVYITRSENLVDACVDMIEKLHELKML